jgi:L-iditol 2-dehydrogenase
MMKAILKRGDAVELAIVPIPQIQNTDDVLIEIQAAGLCRTDISVAEGSIECIDPCILGHEFSGVIKALGSAVTEFKPGDKVTVMPVISCGKCRDCQSGHRDLCQYTAMLGIDRHGAFAEYIVVSAQTVYRIPDAMDFKVGAYAEPVAASAAVMKTGIKSDQKGLIYGRNRIAELVRKILASHGFFDVELCDELEGSTLVPNQYDFIIETIPTESAFLELMSAIRPGGTVIIKSRKHQLVGINFAQAVRKEIRFHAVNYASFDEAIRLLAHELPVHELLGELYPLDAFKAVFEQAKQNESLKLFFLPGALCAE